MTILRSFTARDIPVLKKEMYPSLSSEQIGAFICEWEKKKYKDRYFEMFAVICGDFIVGSVSLYEIGDGEIEAGPEIFERYRRKGYGEEAVISALSVAKDKGYRRAAAHVRADNAASIALHETLGFHRRGETTDSNNRRVYLYYKEL